MNVSVTNEGTETVVVVTGEVDADNCARLGAAVSRHSPVGDVVVVDMSGVGFIDSSGISELLQLQRKLEADDRTLRMPRPSAAVRRVLEITGLLDVLQVD